MPVAINRDKERLVTAELVRELFDYDPETGIVTRRARPSPRNKKGEIVGSNSGAARYLQVGILYHNFLLHRVIWLHVHGAWPSELIDHINCNRTDNRLCNLREATVAQNVFNRPREVKSRAPYKGVLRLPNGQWRARVRFNGKLHVLGTFATPEAAHAAYLTAARSFFGEFARAA